MNVIIDPFTQAAHCGTCGAVAVDLVHAYDCCADRRPSAPLLAIALSAALLVGTILLFIVLPLLLTC